MTTTTLSTPPPLVTAPRPGGPTSRAHTTRTNRARNKQTADYFDLIERVRAEGLMERHAGRYVVRAVAFAVALAVGVALLVTLGETWWQLAVAAYFGIVFGQGGFLAHDAAHRQIFASGSHNDWFARLVGTLGVGLSIGWWKRKHNKHHGNPNVIGVDGDIATGALVFVPGEDQGRTGVLGWITRHQGWLFFPMLTLFAPVFHAHSVHSLVTTPQIQHRWSEAGLLALRLIGFPVLVFTFLSPGLGAAFLAVQLVVFGVYLAGSFAPNHKGMPLLPKDSSVDFLRRQVLTSRNITGGPIVDWAMGGLNYQIEHHIFPKMPSANLRRVQPIVKEFCLERDIPYTETSLVDSYGIIIRYLNRVGLGHADPMECPIRSQYR